MININEKKTTCILKRKYDFPVTLQYRKICILSQYDNELNEIRNEQIKHLKKVCLEHVLPEFIFSASEWKRNFRRLM